MADFEKMKHVELEPNRGSLLIAMSVFSQELREAGYLEGDIQLDVGNHGPVGGKHLGFEHFERMRTDRNTLKRFTRSGITFPFQLPVDETSGARELFTIPDMSTKTTSTLIQKWRDSGRVPPHIPEHTLQRRAQVSLFNEWARRISNGIEYDLQCGALYLLQETVVAQIENIIRRVAPTDPNSLEMIIKTAKELYVAIQSGRAEVTLEVARNPIRKVGGGKYPNELRIRVEMKDWEDESTA